jgi:hypothetical protein
MASCLMNELQNLFSKWQKCFI